VWRPLRPTSRRPEQRHRRGPAVLKVGTTPMSSAPGRRHSRRRHTG
jgi:hypothetical protein